MILREAITFTKFHEDWTKIIDFLLLANIWMCLVFFTQTLYGYTYFFFFANFTFVSLLNPSKILFSYRNVFWSTQCGKTISYLKKLKILPIKTFRNIPEIQQFWESIDAALWLVETGEFFTNSEFPDSFLDTTLTTIRFLEHSMLTGLKEST